jgi:hypothetical protein
VEASFDVAASSVLSDAQKERVMARCGPVVRAVAQDDRSQARNRELALERLRARLQRAHRRPARAAPDEADRGVEGRAGWRPSGAGPSASAPGAGRTTISRTAHLAQHRPVLADPLLQHRQGAPARPSRSARTRRRAPPTT